MWLFSSLFILTAFNLVIPSLCWISKPSYRFRHQLQASSIDTSSISSIKYQIVQLGAALDRGQAYNPTSGEFYKQRIEYAKNKVKEIIRLSNESNVPKSLSDIDGDWELVLTTVPHGIFRSSPFFLAIQQAYANAGQLDKANLFFKLHELQTLSWGISKIGKVAQSIDSSKGVLTSEFDTALLSLTVIPIVGWFKLLPTFGGTVVTVAKASISPDTPGKIDMEVDYTTAKKVEGLNGLSDSIWNTKIPVGDIWKQLPWNNGQSAKCHVFVRYADDDFRIVEDIDGEFFVYTRPI